MLCVAVGPSAQVRDTRWLGEEDCAYSNLRRSDYVENEMIVL